MDYCLSWSSPTSAPYVQKTHQLFTDRAKRRLRKGTGEAKTKGKGKGKPTGKGGKPGGRVAPKAKPKQAVAPPVMGVDA